MINLTEAEQKRLTAALPILEKIRDVRHAELTEQFIRSGAADSTSALRDAVVAWRDVCTLARNLCPETSDRSGQDGRGGGAAKRRAA